MENIQLNTILVRETIRTHRIKERINESIKINKALTPAQRNRDKLALKFINKVIIPQLKNGYKMLFITDDVEIGKILGCSKDQSKRTRAYLCDLGIIYFIQQSKIRNLPAYFINFDYLIFKSSPNDTLKENTMKKVTRKNIKYRSEYYELQKAIRIQEFKFWKELEKRNGIKSDVGAICSSSQIEINKKLAFIGIRKEDDLLTGSVLPDDMEQDFQTLLFFEKSASKAPATFWMNEDDWMDEATNINTENIELNDFIDSIDSEDNEIDLTI